MKFNQSFSELKAAGILGNYNEIDVKLAEILTPDLPDTHPANSLDVAPLRASLFWIRTAFYFKWLEPGWADESLGI